MHYTIGETAERLGVAPSTLRYYDKEGLLPFVERSPGGVRLFRDTDFKWLNIIECLKKTGMPIRDIRTYIDLCFEGDHTISARQALIDKQRQAVLSQMEQLQETLAILNYKHWYYERAKEAGSCSVNDSLPPDAVPEEYRAAALSLQRAKTK